MVSNEKHSSSTNYSNNGSNRLLNKPSLRVKLSLRFESQKKGQCISQTCSFSSATTIDDVTQELLKFVRSKITDVPKDIVLVSFYTNGCSTRVPLPNSEKTLRALTIMDGYELNFEPSRQSRPELSYLTVHAPNSVKKIECEWDEATTTLGMLVEYIIKSFALETTERSRIHLLKSSRIELDHISDANKLLSSLGVNNHASISVVIDSSRTSSDINEKTNIHVMCSYFGGKFILDARMTDTINDLIIFIKRRFENDLIISFELFNAMDKKIDLNYKSKMLGDFGIKPGQTIRATIRLGVGQNSSRLIDKRVDMPPLYSSVASGRVTRSYTSTGQYQYEPKPIGLDNLGNTCFMNSALQCLFHVKPLTDFFLNAFTQAHSDDGEHKNDDCNPFDACGNVTGAYAELIWNLSRHDKTDQYYSSFKPDRIKETIGCLAPQFATWDQQDAQEFLSFLLDALHDEFKEQNKPNPNNLIKELFFGQMQSTITCLKCKHAEITINPFCILSLPLNRQERLFSINFISSDGHQDSAVLYVPTCGRVEHLVLAFAETRKSHILFYRIYAMTTNTNEHLPFETPLSELPDQCVTLIEQEDDVDFKRRRPDRYETQPHKLTLEECLREFVSLELLEDLWFCSRDGCKQRTEASKQLQLSTLPPILVIQLKRFSHDGSQRQKIDTLADYPINKLDLSHLLPLSETAVYDLIAVSNHVGSIHHGHYTAYARQNVSTDKWYKFDDDFVSSVYYSSDIVSRDAYLLFYIKRNDQKQSSESKSTTS